MFTSIVSPHASTETTHHPKPDDDTWSWYIWSATFLLFYGALGMFFAYCGTIIYPEECVGRSVVLCLVCEWAE